jgi:hypothetical protein
MRNACNKSNHSGVACSLLIVLGSLILAAIATVLFAFKIIIAPQFFIIAIGSISLVLLLAAKPVLSACFGGNQLCACRAVCRYAKLFYISTIIELALAAFLITVLPYIAVFFIILYFILAFFFFISAISFLLMMITAVNCKCDCGTCCDDNTGCSCTR